MLPRQEQVCTFHLGSCRLGFKWFYNRRGKKGQPGRTLTPDDIAHSQRIVVALKDPSAL